MMTHHTHPINTTLNRIRAVVGRSGWLDGADGMAPYLTESRGMFQGRAAAVVRPHDTEQVAEILRLCHTGGIGVVPQGGNTGRCAGAVPEGSREIVVALDRLRRIRRIDADDYTLIAEAGCVLAEVQAAAARADRLFPLSLGAEGSCQIGGNLATNAGGTNVLRYGNARDLTLGLEVVLPTGEIWQGLNTLRKNNAGYDLKNLFIGAEGTLGIITAAALKLFPMPTDRQTAFVALDDLDDCVALLDHARVASGDALTTFELISRPILELALRHIPGCRDPFATPHRWYVLMVFSGSGAVADTRERLENALAQAYQDELIQDAALAVNEAQARAFWKLREGIVEAQRNEGVSIKHDVAVPVSRVPAFIREASHRVESALPGIRVCPFGHVGDGNIHFNLSQPVDMAPDDYLARRAHLNSIVHDVAVAMNGTFSAEHGIGLLKVPEMLRYKSPLELELMRKIKQAVDPHGIMNPGKVLPGVPYNQPGHENL